VVNPGAGGRAELKPRGDGHSFDVRMWNGKLPIGELGKIQ
jgi:hypothetical protein